jgi:hypothetical protein
MADGNDVTCDIHVSLMMMAFQTGWVRVRFSQLDGNGNILAMIDDLKEFKDLEHRYVVALEQYGISYYYYVFSTDSFYHGADEYPRENFCDELFEKTEDRQLLDAAISRMRAGSTSEQFVFQRHMDDGSARWNKCMLTSLVYRRGENIDAVITLEDVQQRMEEEDRYKSVKDNLDVLLAEACIAYHFNLDRDTISTVCDDGDYELPAITSVRTFLDELIPYELDDGYPVLDLEQMRAVSKEGARTLTSHYKLKTKEGQYKVVGFKTYLMRNGANDELEAYFIGTDENRAYLEKKIKNWLINLNVEFFAYIDVSARTLTVLSSKNDLDNSHYGDTFDYDSHNARFNSCFPEEERERMLKELSLDFLVEKLSSSSLYTSYFYVIAESGEKKYQKITSRYIDDARNYISSVRVNITGEITEWKDI